MGRFISVSFIVPRYRGGWGFIKQWDLENALILVLTRFEKKWADHHPSFSNSLLLSRSNTSLFELGSVLPWILVANVVFPKFS